MMQCKDFRRQNMERHFTMFFNLLLQVVHTPLCFPPPPFSGKVSHKPPPTGILDAALTFDCKPAKKIPFY